MKTKEDFIRKYGKQNYNSVYDAINMTLAILYSQKRIKYFKISKRKGKVFFFFDKENIKEYNIIELYYMKEKEIIKIARRRNNGRQFIN